VKPTALLKHDAAENIVYVSFPGVQLESKDEIRAHFDDIVAFWTQHCGGRKVYYVVNYDHITVSLQENDFYAQQMKRVLAHAITVVRYGGDPLQRTAARLANMKLRAPTRLYESLDEAMAVVYSLKAGTRPVDAPT
jgi:antirestriction protein ArdC